MSPPANFPRPWGHGRCYGDLVKWAPRSDLFALWWSLRSWLLSFPSNATAASGASSGGAEPRSDGGWSFSSGAFPLRLPGALFFSSGKLLSASAPPRVRRLHYDLFGSRRGTSTLNLQIELFWSLSGRGGGAPFQRVFLAWLKSFSSRQSSSFESVFQLECTLETSPSSCACTRPVAIRQRSTAS